MSAKIYLLKCLKYVNENYQNISSDKKIFYVICDIDIWLTSFNAKLAVQMLYDRLT